MLQYKGYKLFPGLLFIMPFVVGIPQDTTTVKPGRYVPELYGAHLGKYIPDDSGKYTHMPRPYDGGYGDRGVKYIHDSSGKLIPVSANDLLGPKDHLRFMIDFNYDNNGWQIIKFEWLRDGDENYKYQYVNENQLWSSSDQNNSGEANAGDTSGNDNAEQNKDDDSGVHIDGEYNEEKGYNYSYSDADNTNKNSKNLQQAIKEVLDYIEVNILPTL